MATELEQTLSALAESLPSDFALDMMRTLGAKVGDILPGAWLTVWETPAEATPTPDSTVSMRGVA